MKVWYTLPVTPLSNRAALRRRLFKRQKGKCFYCKRTTIMPVSGNSNDDLNATIEHLYTKLDIRRLLLRNYEKTVIACFKCNSEKGWKDADEFEAAYMNLPMNVIIDIRKFCKKVSPLNHNHHDTDTYRHRKIKYS